MSEYKLRKMFRMPTNVLLSRMFLNIFKNYQINVKTIRILSRYKRIWQHEYIFIYEAKPFICFAVSFCYCFENYKSKFADSSMSHLNISIFFSHRKLSNNIFCILSNLKLILSDFPFNEQVSSQFF